MMWVWLALNIKVACAGTSDELRAGIAGIVVAVAQGRCEVVL